MLIALSINIGLFASALNRPVDEWRWWVVTDPRSAAMVVAQFFTTVVDLSYREGGAARFFRKYHGGVAVSVLSVPLCVKEFTLTLFAVRGMRRGVRGHNWLPASGLLPPKMEACLHFVDLYFRLDRRCCLPISLGAYVVPGDCFSVICWEDRRSPDSKPASR